MTVISFPFSSITIQNGEKATVSLSINDLTEHTRTLISEGYLNINDMIEEITAQIKPCDKNTLLRILSKENLNNLIAVYSFIENGE
jgi:hypothetical protein